MDTVDVIERIDPRRGTGGCDWSIFVYGVLGMLCNLTNTFYTYMLTSHPTTILLVYLMCYIQLSSFTISLGNIMNTINSGNMIPYIANIQHYYTSKLKHIKRDYKPKNKRWRFHNRTKNKIDLK